MGKQGYQVALIPTWGGEHLGLGLGIWLKKQLFPAQNPELIYRLKPEPLGYLLSWGQGREGTGKKKREETFC